MASTSISRTPSSAGNRRKFTLSVWCKKHSSSQMNFIGTGASNDQNHIQFADDRFRIRHFSNTSDILVSTKALLRDTSAWYHLVCSVDTTQSTASNRVKLYINGELAELNDTTYPSQNYDWNFNDTEIHYIGRRAHSNAYLFDGIMSHFHWIDGTAYDASPFGSTDSTTGQWTINLEPSVTYGTNGFFLFKDNASLTDQSGNSNNFTLSAGTLTKTEDTPSNVFATMNRLDNYYFNGTFSNGDNTVVSNAGVESYWTSTLGASSGKFYWEVKISSSGSGKDFIGIADKVAEASDFTPYSGNSNMRSYYGFDGEGRNGSTDTGVFDGATFGTGDIIGVAMDLDNNKLYFSKNGTFQNSGVPTSGSTGTGAMDIPTSSTGYWFAQGANIHNTSSTFQTNFGNGFFGTTAVSSAGTNASGHGIFEYDVPTGYTALCTKGINSF